jgi:mannose-6-phosphate isomerase-like protein (cupin superfamily)
MKIVSLANVTPQGVVHNPDIIKRVLLPKGTIPHLTNFSQAVFLPQQVAPAHRHEQMVEVFFAVSGSGTITINETPHLLAMGTCVLVDAGELHEVANTGTVPLVLLYFGIQL